MATDDDRERFRAAMAVMDGALDLPANERTAYLDRECASAGPELRKEVERLLEADARADDFLSVPAGAKIRSAISGLTRPRALRAAVGDRVGPFRLVSLLGQGGMGEVWTGEREGADFEQRVAVKLLATGIDAESTRLRFRRERRILARLSHPHIARLLDGGVTEDGHLWLAMELVIGRTLTEHCAAKNLGVGARLKIFLDVCEAVQLAHRNLVIHRDLKPGNILVTDAGQAKLLDFGIAKLTEEEEGGDALTRADERPMTPDYAAPEQVRGDDVTTASDVWTLGVILYELLTGARPYQPQSKNRVAVERAILDGPPARPSSRIAPNAEAMALIGEPSVKALKKKLRGDLDAIVLKAMRAAPEDRYPSAEALAADVRHHLEGKPVSARGDATGYLIRAMVKRHRATFAFSTLVLIALVFGLVGTLWQAARAREEAARAERAQEFLLSMLRAFDPYEQGGRPVTQREILERGEARARAELTSQPEVLAKLLRTFAETWFNLGEDNRAAPPAEDALAIERRVLGPRDLEVAKTLVVLGDVRYDQLRFADAARAYSEALDIARAADHSSVDVASALNGISGVERRLGQFKNAERDRRESLTIYTRVLGPEAVPTIEVTNNLAVLLADEGHLAPALTMQRHACVSLEKLRGAKHPDTLRCRYQIARELLEMGDPAGANTLLIEVIALQQEVPGKAAKDTDSMYLRARALDALGRSKEAIALFEEVMARDVSAFGPDHARVATALPYIADAYRYDHDAAHAESLARRAVTLSQTIFGEDFHTARARVALGAALTDLGRASEARDELTKAIATMEATFGAEHPEVAQAHAELERAKQR